MREVCDAKTDEALARLVLAEKQRALAELLLPTEGVVFAYSSIDNVLAALISLAGETPPKDHGVKIGRFRHHYPGAASVVAGAARLTTYLDWSKASRYDGAERTVSEYIEVARSADGLFNFAVRIVAAASCSGEDRVHDTIRTKAAQERTEAWRQEIGDIQEGLFTHLQSSAEGRAGFFAAVGHLCNFISLQIDTDTPEVRQLLREHPAVTKAAVGLYEKFLELVEAARMWNAGRMMDEHQQGAPINPDDFAKGFPDYVTKAMGAGADFRLVALLSYRGTDLLEHVKQVWDSLLKTMAEDRAREEGKNK
jgi:hypothetical protein